MRKNQRPRHFVGSPTLLLTRPLFRYSMTRDAYILRLAGNRTGPVLKRDRRRGESNYTGPERRSDRRA